MIRDNGRMSGADWVRYWRAEGAPVEAMRAHFTSHVYHRHSHESYSFGVTQTGAQAFACRSGEHVSGPGMVMTFNPDDPHDGHAASGDGFTYLMVHIWPEYLARLAGGVPLPLFREPVMHDADVAAALRRLYRLLTGTTGSALERDELLTTTARLLVGRAGGSAADPPARMAGSGQIAARVKELINADHDCGGGLTLSDLAVAANCSRYAAYRAFTGRYGMTPSDYQRQLRLRSARKLLAAGMPPARAAAETGFADQPHLTRWFRRHYGVTPAVYQRAAGR